MLSVHVHAQPVAVTHVPDGCEAEVCMSHMDPVSGTDIDLFIEGIIPCSLHLDAKKSPTQKFKIKVKISCDAGTFWGGKIMSLELNLDPGASAFLQRFLVPGESSRGETRLQTQTQINVH